MSDISIPGVTSKYKTDQIVEALVKKETLKLDNLKEDVKVLETNKKEWQDMSRLMTTLRNTSRGMYNQDNPFTERSASSPDPAIAPTASREAVEGITRVQVVQLAQADRFGSKSLDKNLAIPEGNYTFSVGEEDIPMHFRGGTIREFADALTRRADGRIKASIIKDRPDSQILLIESQKTGSAWPLRFKDDAIKLGLELGMVEQKKGASISLPLNQADLRPWTSPLEKQKDNLISNGTMLTVKAGAELSIPIPSGFVATDKMVLEYQVRAHTNSADQWKPPAKPTGPIIPLGPSVTLRDVTLPDLPSRFELPKYVEPKMPEIITDNQMLFAARGTQTTPLPEVNDSVDFKTVTVPLTNLGLDITAINVRNRNTLRDLDIQGIRIADPTSRGDYVPANPISTSQDAIIKVEGIEIVRDTNTIKDAIPGVTLTLNDTTEKAVPIKVEPDRKLVFDKMVEFITSYNSVIREINIATARKDNTELVNEVEFWDDKQKEEATKRLGMFQGDSTLNIIKNRLQLATSNAYPTSAGKSLTMLAQAGISTNASTGAGGGDVSTSKLHGYLEANQKSLDKALAENFLALKELFGKDTNGDLIPDSGVGVELDKNILPYVQIGGIFVAKTSSVDTQLKGKNTEIKNYEVYLQDFKAKQKEKYGKMEAAVNSMQQSAKGLDSLNNNKN